MAPSMETLSFDIGKWNSNNYVYPGKFIKSGLCQLDINFDKKQAKFDFKFFIGNGIDNG